MVSCVLLYIFEPPLDISESFNLCDVIGDDDCMGRPVVALGDCAESLLPGRVPNLQLTNTSVSIQSHDLIRNANFLPDIFRVGKTWKEYRYKYLWSRCEIQSFLNV